MKLMVNYSEPARDLVKSGAIRFDFFKAPEWEWVAGPAMKVKPVRVHFGPAIGALSCWTYDRAAMRQWMKRTGTRYANVHLMPQGSEIWVLDPRARDAESVSKALARLHRDIEIYVDTFGAENVLVENVPHWGGRPDELMCMPGALPEVIHEIVTSHGVGLLLDFAHARISAMSLGMDVKQYIQALPIQQLRECHVTGIADVDGKLRDHMPMQDVDWGLLGWGIEQIRSGRWSRPWAIGFEYGGLGEKFAWRCDPEVLRQQVPRLREMVKDV